jgi:hypothetical protein
MAAGMASVILVKALLGPVLPPRKGKRTVLDFSARILHVDDNCSFCPTPTWKHQHGTRTRE